MSETRQSIVHDPHEKVDLTGNTVAAGQRVRFRLDKAIDSTIDVLHAEGLPKDGHLLIWQLVGDHLRRRAGRMEATAFGFEKEEVTEKPGNGVSPVHDGP